MAGVDDDKERSKQFKEPSNAALCKPPNTSA